MKLELESGAVITSPSEMDLERIEGEEFAILSRESGTYMQCAEQNEPPWEYVLEYQQGDLDRHFHAVDGPITWQRVRAAFAKYLRDDATWKKDFVWEKLELE